MLSFLVILLRTYEETLYISPCSYTTGIIKMQQLRIRDDPLLFLILTKLSTLLFVSRQCVESLITHAKRGQDL